jgi:hypothetical protein
MLYRRMPVLRDESPRGIAHEHHVEVLIGVLMQSFDLHAWIQRLPGDTGCLDVERADARLGEGHTALLSQEYYVSGGLRHTWHACSTRVVPRRKGDQTRFYGIGLCSRTPHGPCRASHGIPGRGRPTAYRWLHGSVGTEVSGYLRTSRQVP